MKQTCRTACRSLLGAKALQWTGQLHSSRGRLKASCWLQLHPLTDRQGGRWGAGCWRSALSTLAGCRRWLGAARCARSRGAAQQTPARQYRPQHLCQSLLLQPRR